MAQTWAAEAGHCTTTVVDPRRTYLPIGWLKPPTVPSNLLKVLPADPWLFGVLSCRAHMAWLRAVAGSLSE